MTPTKPCERCNRLVVDASTNFGGLLFDPVCGGIEVKVEAENGLWRQVCVITADELRAFLSRAYGEPAVAPTPAPCPCGEPNPPGMPPCTFERPCGYGKGKPQSRWS